MELIEKHASFGGWQNVYRHYSQSLKCEMNVGVYLPPKAASEKLPVLYWLSGLTCNEQNFITKSGMQRYAAEHNIIVVAPDTSPRGSHVADADRYDLGQGAGFYLNATQAPWNEHYKMYDYIRNELPDLVMQHFPATARKSINKDAWLDYDPVSLISQGQRIAEIMVDQGLSDDFYAEQLRTPNLEKICQEMNIKTLIRYHEGYDHSYYFVSSFIGEHIAYHANKLNMR
ncbi:S-formylglutathione hydrolase [Shigella boydii]|nr:S-formylglutathione hydrolase [Shigella boydii]